MKLGNQDFDFDFVDEQPDKGDIMKELEDLILPLLEKLADPTNTNDLIKWPHKQRIAQVSAQIEKIKKITRG